MPRFTVMRRDEDLNVLTAVRLVHGPPPRSQSP